MWASLARGERGHPDTVRTVVKRQCLWTGDQLPMAAARGMRGAGCEMRWVRLWQDHFPTVRCPLRGLDKGKGKIGL